MPLRAISQSECRSGHAASWASGGVEGPENFRGWTWRIWFGRFPDHEHVFVATWSNTVRKRHRCRKNRTVVEKTTWPYSQSPSAEIFPTNPHHQQKASRACLAWMGRPALHLWPYGLFRSQSIWTTDSKTICG